MKIKHLYIHALNIHSTDKNVTYEPHQFRDRPHEAHENAVMYIIASKDSFPYTCNFNEHSSEDAIIDQFASRCSSQCLRCPLLKGDKLTFANVGQLASS